MIYTGTFAGFRAARLDAQMEEGPEGTPPSSDPDGGDPHPCPEDDEFLAYLMLKAKKRLSTGLWRVWNNRNAVALLQRNLPDKTGEKGKWIFEKAHSIHRPSQTAISMSPVNRESAILHLLPC